ncbi:MAG: FtsX-like permease family protein [candidate division WS1 bacterium]|jgi:putative ABC transport system permease protein|nr:FtsX-like permease family protein [candidate division WS1 bacterium]
MSFAEAIRSALVSLLANKTRSFLTMLGVIIGVAAVLIVVAIGEGLKTDTLNRIRSMGTNLITIVPGGGRGADRRPGRLTEDDFKALKANIKHVKLLAPVVQTNATAKYRNLSHKTQVVGTTAEWAEAMAFTVEHGRFITLTEERARTRVAVLGQEVVNELFYGRPLVGEFIRIQGVPFEVIGILQEKGGGWGDPDNQIVIPISTARQRLVGGAEFSRIYASAVNENVVPDAIESIKRTLYRLHRVDEITEDFRIRDQTEMLATMTETTGQLTTFVSGIALVSLLVGGVGIMNIMLVSVAERTREIGIRKAVGARRRDILSQFLIEAVMLSLIGGLIGIGIGFAVSRTLGSTLGWETVVPLWSILLSCAFSGAVGVFFGWYPAQKAAALDPIECLRYE